MPALVGKTVSKKWHSGRQKLIYVLKELKRISPL